MDYWTTRFTTSFSVHRQIKVKGHRSEVTSLLQKIFAAMITIRIDRQDHVRDYAIVIKPNAVDEWFVFSDSLGSAPDGQSNTENPSLVSTVVL